MNEPNDPITPEQLEKVADELMSGLKDAPSFPDDPDAEMLILYLTIMLAGVAATYRKVAKQLRELQGTPRPDPSAN